MRVSGIRLRVLVTRRKIPYEAHDSFAKTFGAHSLRTGVEFRRNQINMTRGHRFERFLRVCAVPGQRSFASFLLGFPVVFFQGGGDFNRGLRNIDFAAYAQDEWRVTPRLTINYGLRWEVSTPFTDIRNRMNAWSPGKQSKVYPNAPAGLLFPGDPGVPRWHRARLLERLSCRGSASRGIPPVRVRRRSAAAYGIFYDSFTNGVGGPLQAPLSALPWTQARQLPPPINFTDPMARAKSFFAQLVSRNRPRF